MGKRLAIVENDKRLENIANTRGYSVGIQHLIFNILNIHLSYTTTTKITTDSSG